MGASLSGVVWDRVFSSPRRRARHTAEILLGQRSEAPALTIDERLVELDFGPYEGWSEDELSADPVAAKRRSDGAELDGMERVASVAARAGGFMLDLADLPGNSLVIGHGRMLRILLAACVLGLPAGGSQRLRMRNCRPAIVEPGRTPLLLGFNVGPPADEAAGGNSAD